MRHNMPQCREGGCGDGVVAHAEVFVLCDHTPNVMGMRIGETE